MSDKNITYYKGNECKKISEETLQADISQYLQMDNLSFLIGAGCSSNIVEGKETGIPGMSLLYKEFFEQEPDFSIANQKLNGKFDNNLEKMLEAMGAISVANQILEIEPDVDNKLALVRKFLREKIVSGLNSDEVKSIYKSFYSKITQKSRKNPISVFTTNYDLFNEMALDELGFPYNNGFSGTYRRKFNPTSYNYMYVENMNINRDTWEKVSSFFNLIKLHGSISWFRENEEIWEKDSTNITDDDTVMIYPTPLKDRSTLMTPYSDLFRVMENRIIQKNSVLIVLGYSFSDEHINRVILNGLSLPTFRLIIFGTGTNIEKLIALNDARITIINSDDKVHYFNNFVEKALPAIHPDIEEEMKLKPINQMISIFEKAVKDE